MGGSWINFEELCLDFAGIYLYIYIQTICTYMNVYNAQKRNRLHATLVQTRLSNKKTSQVRWYSFHYNVRARCPHKLFWSQTSACNRSIARTFPLPGAVAATLGSRCCFAVGSADFGEPIASAADWKTDAVDEQNPTNEFLCNSSHGFLGCMPWKKGNISPSCIFCWNRPILSENIWKMGCSPCGSDTLGCTVSNA